MSTSAKRRRALARRRRRRRLIRLYAAMMFIITCLAAGILLCVFTIGKRMNKPTTVTDKTVETEESEATESEEDLIRKLEAQLGHKVPRKTDYVFHKASIDNGNFYAIQNAASVDISEDTEISSKYVILINADDWTIVAYKKPYERMVPASMTKVLTVLTAKDNLTEEQMTGSYAVDREITDYVYLNECSAAGFELDTYYPIKDYFYATILPSGADGAVGLANYTAGSQDAFVELMNQQLADLDLGETSHFTNCVGLYGEEHYSTAYDIAMIMWKALQDPFLKDVLTTHIYTTTPTATYPSGIELSNKFLRRIEDLEFGGTILSAKTGYVNQSGNCAVSSEIADDGTMYICVTGGADGNWTCIYDHQYIYEKYAAKKTTQTTEQTTKTTGAGGTETAGQTAAD